jgi:hypothetical protein
MEREFDVPKLLHKETTKCVLVTDTIYLNLMGTVKQACL